MSSPLPTGRVPRSLVTLFDRLREGGLARDTSLKWVLGVCSGIAARVGVDPIVVRLVFLVLVSLGGFGLLPYLIAAILLPDEKGTIHLEEAFRQRRGPSLWIVVVVAAIIGGELSDRRAVAALALVALTVWWVVSGRDRPSVSPQDAPRPPSPWAPMSTAPVSHGLGPGRTDVPSADPVPSASAVPGGMPAGLAMTASSATPA
ncbi:MAG TPA: PspC domain-containing protein, partial [Dermatophilaceae bacterium]|nr:PspC domain-containing protein [Dermatophilaceae bacterium]